MKHLSAQLFALTIMCIFTITFICAVTPATASSIDGKSLYSSCKGCHGSDGGRPAMGVGAPLKGQDAATLEKKMLGYKDGTYGGEKKGMMVKFMKGLSADRIKALANYISTLE